MIRLVAGLLLAGGLALISLPARADSDPYVVRIASVGASGAAAVAVATGTASGLKAFKYYALQVKGRAATATTWNVVLEGSLDGSNFTSIFSHATADGDGAVKVSTSPVIFPATSFRARVTAISLGSSTGLNITAIGIDR